jgi:GGDEF domain-containing protein
MARSIRDRSRRARSNKAGGSAAKAGANSGAKVDPEVKSEPGKPKPEYSPKAATCLDIVSGLYHPEHFELSLSYEFSRMERTEKPLGLVLVRLGEAAEDCLKAFKVMGSFIKSALRPLDLAARLGEREVAILMPEAQRDRAVRLLLALGREFEANPLFSGASFGASLARPYEGAGPADLLRRAGQNTGSAQQVAKKLLSGASPWAEIDTALIADEKDSLFDGFSVLSAPLPPRTSVRRP